MELPFAGSTLLVDPAGEGMALLDGRAADLWRARGAAAGRAFARRIGRELALGRTRGALPPRAAATPPAAICDRLHALGGVRVAIACDDPGLDPMVQTLFAPLRTSGAASPTHHLRLARDGRRVVLWADGQAIAASADPDHALGLLIDAVLDRAWPAARWMAVAHAGAVADARGAVLLPAPSGGGKSTLAAGLVAAGWRFLSDDIAPVDAGRAEVAPVPLALSAREGSWPILRQLFPGMRPVATLAFEEGRRRFLDLARYVAQEPAPLRALLVPQFDPSGAPGLDRLDPGQALAALVEGRCWLSRERPLLQRLLSLLETVPAFKGRYRTLEEGVALVNGL
ncbi:hypothetical protein [Marinimicrococcus flavescens]|uniref:Serine kinase n=1 Tax=Marinimicrococcus flavescens TaxID=3031815 RepID=A0AAP3XSE1_9PROT|nr:hypothetical protein [Marinimicrococcus flavescens]